MNYHEKLGRLVRIDGQTASIRVGDVDWTTDGPDLNEQAANEAADIMREAFGAVPDWDDARALHENEWVDVQLAWTEPDAEETITAPAAFDEDGSPDLWTTAERISDALEEFGRERFHLTDEQRAAEVAKLRAAFPHLIQRDA